MKRQPIADHIGTCPDCGKYRYVSKQAAKKTAKKLFPDDRLSPYRCGDYWHFGHLPYAVQRGINPRGT